MLAVDRLPPERLRRIRREEYERLVEAGVFEGERIELLSGRLVEMSPQGDRHAHVVRRLNRLLVLAADQRAQVDPQLPLIAGEDSIPEPDVALIPWSHQEARHPDEAYLVIEVADSSLRLDREVKRPLYASADVPQYCIVNLQDDVVEIYEDPHGDHYRSSRTVGRGESFEVKALPGLVLRVDDFMP